jgi:S1-C subfamily serine protease
MPVGSVTELQEQVGKFRPGDQTSITYIRGGQENTVPIKMKSLANSTDIVKGGEAFGARLEPISQSEKDKYRIDYGVKITEIGDGRLSDLGMKKGYIILGINGKKVRSASDVKDLTEGEQNLESIEGFQSNGTYFSYQFKR